VANFGGKGNSCKTKDIIMSTKMLPARRADNSAILVVLNVRLRVEVQHYIPL